MLSVASALGVSAGQLVGRVEAERRKGWKRETLSLRTYNAVPLHPFTGDGHVGRQIEGHRLYCSLKIMLEAEGRTVTHSSLISVVNASD